MNSLRSPLGRAQVREAATVDDLRKRARSAWHRPLKSEDDRWLCVRLGDIVGWDDRQLAVNLGNKVNGKRGK